MNKRYKTCEIIPVEGIPWIEAGDSIGLLVVEALNQNEIKLEENDIIVIAQKIVSKAEGQIRDLKDVIPSLKALELSKKMSNKDPRLVELILQESKRILRVGDKTVIVETIHGFKCANAGIDLSNTGVDLALLLPVDSDASAWLIRSKIEECLGIAPGVIISDTFGRPWRRGTTDIALGVAGLNPLHSFKGKKDKFGHPVRSVDAVADEITGAAVLVMGKFRDVPVAILRGCDILKRTGSGQDLLKPIEKDIRGQCI